MPRHTHLPPDHRQRRALAPFLLAGTAAALAACTEPTATETAQSAADSMIFTAGRYTIEQTLSDQAQQNTIAFDALAFLTGNVGAQSFLPPGKVADYSGFQYLRDNDPTNLGHNTDFVTIVAFNVLHILSASQVDQLVESARVQVQPINEFAYARFPLLNAFRRHLEGDLPSGSTGLDSAAVTSAVAELYRLDGRISYHRAELMGTIVRSLSTAQRTALAALKARNGVGNWERTLSDPLEGLRLDRDVGIAVMTYASELYAWYAGSVTADVYFCPERQGTYFGSFYLKDWPAMGNPNYTIDEQLTASAGQEFLDILTPAQAEQITGILPLQANALQAIVSTREAVSRLLRGFMTGSTVDSTAILALSAKYGALDGLLAYWYTTRFTAVANRLSAAQRAQVQALASRLGYVQPAGGFLYSSPIPLPAMASTDYLFWH